MIKQTRRLVPTADGQLEERETGQRWMIFSSHFQMRCGECGRIINSGLCATKNRNGLNAPAQYICRGHAKIIFGTGSNI